MEPTANQVPPSDINERRFAAAPAKNQRKAYTYAEFLRCAGRKQSSDKIWNSAEEDIQDKNSSVQQQIQQQPSDIKLQETKNTTTTTATTTSTTTTSAAYNNNNNLRDENFASAEKHTSCTFSNARGHKHFAGTCNEGGLQ